MKLSFSTKNTAKMDQEILETLFMLHLKKLYLWPLKDSGDNIDRIFYVKAIAFYAATSAPIADVLLHLWRHKTRQMEVIFYDVNILIVYLTICTMLGLYLYNFKSIMLVCIKINRYCKAREEKRRMWLETNKLCKFSTTLVTCFILAYGIIKLMITDGCQKRMNDYDGRSYCGLMLPSYLSFENDKLKVVLTLLQIISIMYLYRGLIAIFCLCVWALNQIILNLKLLQRSLIQLPSGRSNVFYKNYLREFVILHNNTIRSGKLVDRCTSYIHFVHVTNCSLIFMLEIIDAYINNNFVSFIHLAGWFMALFYLSMLCQIMHNECEVLCHEVYNTRWWEMDVGVRRYILLILQATQKPIYMHAGPLSTVTFQNFLQLVRGAGSYCTIFINLANKSEDI